MKDLQRHKVMEATSYDLTNMTADTQQISVIPWGGLEPAPSRSHKKATGNFPGSLKGLRGLNWNRRCLVHPNWVLHRLDRDAKHRFSHDAAPDWQALDFLVCIATPGRSQSAKHEWLPDRS
jgi:hypothetical protein